MKQLYDKSRLGFALVWIASYCVLMSVGDFLSDMLGIEKSVTLPIAILLSVLLLSFLKRNGLLAQYGFCTPKVSARSMLFYLPLWIMLSVNLWYGVDLNYGIAETLLYVLTMLCVGLLEEVIFRGFLFEAMRQNNVKVAILVSSVTFGIGHIINLIGGSAQDLLPNLLQVVYAGAAGFMFVMLYYRSGSLLACIISHGVFNALSVFSSEAGASPSRQILTAALLTFITGGYGVYIAVSAKHGKAQENSR